MKNCEVPLGVLVDEVREPALLATLITFQDVADLRIGVADLNVDTRNHELALNYIREHIPTLRAGSRTLDLSGKPGEVVDLILTAFRMGGWTVNNCEPDVKGQSLFNLTV